MCLAYKYVDPNFMLAVNLVKIFSVSLGSIAYARFGYGHTNIFKKTSFLGSGDHET